MLNVKWFKVILVIGVVLVSIGRGMAQSKVGTTAAPFLGIHPGARSVSMGGAFTAVCTDASALYYNPGGMLQSGKSQFMGYFADWLVDSQYWWWGLVLNFDGFNSIGFHFTNLNYGDEEEVTTVEQPEGTGEFWGASDMTAGISYARKFTDRFSLGGSVKYIQLKIWNESASTFALDIGLLFITQFNGMRIGMSISNFGSDLQMDGRDLLKRVDLDPETIGHNEAIVSKLKTEGWPLPLFFRVGLAMDVLRSGNTYLTLALDALRPSDNTETINVGAEFSFNEWFFVRSGYKSLFREDSEEGLTFGFGLNIGDYNMGPMNFGLPFSFQLDYAYSDFGLFDEIHMFTLGIGF